MMPPLWGPSGASGAQMGGRGPLFYKDSAPTKLAAREDERTKGLMLEVSKLRHDVNPQETRGQQPWRDSRWQ